MTEWTKEEDEAFNETFNKVEQQSNLGKQILRGISQPPPPRTWIPLTNEEIGELYRAGFSNNTDFARAIEARLKEKNDRPAIN